MKRKASVQLDKNEVDKVSFRDIVEDIEEEDFEEGIDLGEEEEDDDEDFVEIDLKSPSSPTTLDPVAEEEEDVEAAEVIANLSKMAVTKKAATPTNQNEEVNAKLCWVHEDGTARVWGYFNGHDNERRYEVEVILSYGIDSNSLEFKLTQNDKVCLFSYPVPALF